MAAIIDVSEDVDSLNACANANANADDDDDDADADERRTMRAIDSFEEICQAYRTNKHADELFKRTISVSTLKMEENHRTSSTAPPATLPPSEIEDCRPSCSSKTNPDDEYTEFLKRMNARYSQYQFIAEPSGGLQSQNMEFCDYSKYYSYGAGSNSESHVYAQDQMDGTSYCYGGYGHQQAAGSMPQSASCYNYSLASVQQQHQQQHPQQQQHQPHQRQHQQAMPENGMYTYMQSHSMPMNQTDDKESMNHNYKSRDSSPTMQSTPTQSYCNDSCCCFPRRAESRSGGQEFGQEHGHSQGTSMSMGMGMGMAGGGVPMYYPATGGATATASGMYSMNMSGTPLTRQQNVATAGYPSMAMGGFPADVDSFMSKFNQSAAAAQQCFPQAMSMPISMPMQMPCFPMNDANNGNTVNHNNSSSSSSSWGQLPGQLQGLGQGYINDTLQTQTVYASDYKPFAGMGNNFNHFPNGGANGGLDLLNATESSAVSYGAGNGPNPLTELYGGGVGGAADGIGQAIYGMSDQLQGYPLSHLAQMSPAMMGQMSPMGYSSYPPYAGGCDVSGMALNGSESSSYMQSLGICGMNSKAAGS